MSARKPERAAREKCRSLTVDELHEKDKALSKRMRNDYSERRAVRRELKRRSSEHLE